MTKVRFTSVGLNSLSSLVFINEQGPKKFLTISSPLQVTLSQNGTKTTCKTHIRKFEMFKALLYWIDCVQQFSHWTDGVFFWEKELNHWNIYDIRNYPLCGYVLAVAPNTYMQLGLALPSTMLMGCGLTASSSNALMRSLDHQRTDWPKVRYSYLDFLKR